MIIYKNCPIAKHTNMEKAIVEIAYGKYIHDWLESHGFSMLDVIEELENIRKDMPYITDTPVIDLYDTFLYETGFGSNIYDTKEEFLTEEFCDEDYMKELLTEDEYAEYLKIISE